MELTTKYPDATYKIIQKQGKESSLFELTKDGAFVGYFCMSDVIRIVKEINRD